MVGVSGFVWLLATVVAVAGAAFLLVSRREREDGTRFGPYTLEDEIGVGGMGTVYRAAHAMLRRPTAIKVLRPEAMTEESIARFEREVQITSQLTHPSTVAIYDFGRTPDGLFYYAMEYLEGLTLSQMIEMEGPLPPARVIHILTQVCGSLAEAHDAGLIHRDIKPANIVLCKRGGEHDVAKVLDFGLVKWASESVQQALTAAHVVAGTPGYIAPERLVDTRVVTPQIDLYALGAVGYNLLTGRDVFDGSAMEVAHHTLHTQPQPPAARLGRPLPADLERAVLECLSKDPERRPASARAMRDRLQAVEGAGAWTLDDARRWWEDNQDRADETRARRFDANAANDASTTAFDIGRRRF